MAGLIPIVRRTVAAAEGAGIDPDGDDAVPLVDAVVGHFAAALGRPDGTELREWMARQFEAGHDPLVERYWRLVWIVSDWRVVPAHLPFQPWMIKALRRR